MLAIRNLLYEEYFMGIETMIKAMRIRAGLTQEALAQKIGVTPSAVGNYERGVSFPKEEVLLALFGALECSPNELFGEEAYSKEEIDHLRKYRLLDECGRERVDSCTESELGRCGQDADMVPMAARNGGPSRKLRMERRGDKTIFDVPDYRGGRW